MSEPLKLALPKRLTREGRWDARMIAERDELMSHARRKEGMTKEAAQQWTYEELERRYPPLKEAAQEETSAENPRKKALERLTTYTETKTTTEDTQEETAGIGEEVAADTGKAVGEGNRAKTSRRPAADAGDKLVLGIDRVPRSWPPLPPNASLAEEIRWVQAHRIDIVQERSNGSVLVRLSRASAPAPSKAALGWLETSIRAYAKFCDIAAKAATSYQDEAEVEKKERISIDRIRQLLAQMVPADIT